MQYFIVLRGGVPKKAGVAKNAPAGSPRRREPPCQMLACLASLAVPVAKRSVVESATLEALDTAFDALDHALKINHAFEVQSAELQSIAALERRNDAGVCTSDPVDALPAGMTIDAQLGACADYLDTCSSVLVVAEGSKEPRRRANTMNWLSTMEASYRCTAMFVAGEDMVNSSNKLLQSDTAAFDTGVPAVCLFESTRDNLFGLMGRLADAPKSHRVLLALTTHGTLLDERVGVMAGGAGNSVSFGDDHISKRDFKDNMLRPFCTSSSRLLIVWSACFSGGYFDHFKHGPDTDHLEMVDKSGHSPFTMWVKSGQEATFGATLKAAALVPSKSLPMLSHGSRPPSRTQALWLT